MVVMGGAIMCPICGEIVGGWNGEPLTDCACIRNPTPNEPVPALRADDV